MNPYSKSKTLPQIISEMDGLLKQKGRVDKLLLRQLVTQAKQIVYRNGGDEDKPYGNRIVITPCTIESNALFNLLKSHAERIIYQLAHGSCQKAIRVRDLKHYEILPNMMLKRVATVEIQKQPLQVGQISMHRHVTSNPYTLHLKLMVAKGVFERM